MFVDYYKLLDIPFDVSNDALLKKVCVEIKKCEGDSLSSEEVLYLRRLMEARFVFSQPEFRLIYDREYINYIGHNRMSSSIGADWETTYDIHDENVLKLVTDASIHAEKDVAAILYHAVEDRNLMMREVWITVGIFIITVIGLSVFYYSH